MAGRSRGRESGPFFVRQRFVSLGFCSPVFCSPPPHFVSFVEPTERDALHETEAVLDNYFYHDNVAPFLANKLIQRFVTSNPSPRYVQVRVLLWFDMLLFEIRVRDGEGATTKTETLHQPIATFATFVLPDSDVANPALIDALQAASTAFRNGSYDGIGSGEYGDLAATLAAVLLDREAQ